jgi:hypothetical protein
MRSPALLAARAYGNQILLAGDRPKHLFRFLLLTTRARGGNLKVSLKKEVVQKNEFL